MDPLAPEQLRASFVNCSTGEASRLSLSKEALPWANLTCSVYARGLKRSERSQPEETLSVEVKVERLRENLDAFVRRVVQQ